MWHYHVLTRYKPVQKINITELHGCKKLNSTGDTVEFDQLTPLSLFFFPLGSPPPSQLCRRLLIFFLSWSIPADILPTHSASLFFQPLTDD